MKTSSPLKIVILVVFTAFFISGIPYKCLCDDTDFTEAFGTIVKIEEKKIIMNTENGDISIFVKDTTNLSIGSYIRIVYYSITDRGDLFVANSIEILRKNSEHIKTQN